MNAETFRDKVFELVYSCKMNQLYHQHKQHKYWRWDKLVKIAVGLLAVIALIGIYLHEPVKVWIEQPFAWLAMIAAIVLNVIPVGEWEAASGKMFRDWSDLAARTNLLNLKVVSVSDNQNVEPFLIEWYSSLVADEDRLNAQEPAPDNKLLRRCQEDVNKMIYGEG